MKELLKLSAFILLLCSFVFSTTSFVSADEAKAEETTAEETTADADKKDDDKKKKAEGDEEPECE